jgi:glycine cleavage system H protein
VDRSGLLLYFGAAVDLGEEDAEAGSIAAGGLTMKEVDELLVPDDLRYSPDHEWARSEGDRVRIGITDYAQDQLGDVVYVELPAVGAAFAEGQTFGVVESVKAASDLRMPAGGEILEVNDALGSAPQLVNQSPYEGGWMVLIRPSNPEEWGGLLTAPDYLRLLKRDA